MFELLLWKLGKWSNLMKVFFQFGLVQPPPIEIVFDMGIEVFAISWFPGRNCGTAIWSCPVGVYIRTSIYIYIYTYIYIYDWTLRIQDYPEISFSEGIGTRSPYHSDGKGGWMLREIQMLWLNLGSFSLNPANKVKTWRNKNVERVDTCSANGQP